MRVLITGANGQIGQDLVPAFDRDEVVALGHEALDVGDRDQTLQVITSVRPDAIIHAGAWTAVDACESDPDKAFRVNALGTRHVVDGARLTGARVVYVSTAFVFDGTKSSAYNEWDVTNPQSVYGQSKRGGETELGPGDTIVRCDGVCGVHGSNLVKTVLRLAAERDTLSFVEDRRGSPTFTDDLAAMIRHLVVSRLPGTFHVTNQGETTWFGFAQAILAASGHDPARILPITTAEEARPAPRPANSVLDNAALRLQGIPLLPYWGDSLERTVKELTS